MTQKEIEKMNCLLELKYNVFHANLITRAIQDENISVEEFEGGCITICAAEFIDEDEFVPSGWEGV